jgi:acetylcholinesterase
MLLPLLLSLAHVCLAANPTIQLDGANVTGVASGSVWSFLGIPFAQSPYVQSILSRKTDSLTTRRTGDRRFRLPEPTSAYNSSFSATEYGPSCPQQAWDLSSFGQLPREAQQYMGSVAGGEPTKPPSEDCKHLFFLLDDIKH